MQVVIGRIGKAHGIRGEVTVEVRTDDPDGRFAVDAVLMTDRADRPLLTVERARPHHGRLLVQFAGVPDRNAAELLRGILLSVDADSDPDIDDPDEFYDHQLVGLGSSRSTATCSARSPTSSTSLPRSCCPSLGRAPASC